jgi:hypothetical protein
MAKFRERTSVQSHFLLRMLWYGIHLSPLSKLCVLSHTDVRELPAYASPATATRVASTPNSLLYIIDL